MMSNDELNKLKAALRALQYGHYASAELMIAEMIRDVEYAPMDSSYPDGDGYWKEAKENVA
jgi:hypothetical protein